MNIHLFEDYKETENVQKTNPSSQIVAWRESELRKVVEDMQRTLQTNYPEIQAFSKLVDRYKDSGSPESARNLARIVVLYAFGGAFLSDNARAAEKPLTKIGIGDDEKRVVVSESRHQSIPAHVFRGDSRMSHKLLSDNVIIANKESSALLGLLEDALRKIDEYDNYTARVSAADRSNATGEQLLDIAYRRSPQHFLVLPPAALDGTGDEDSYFSNVANKKGLGEVLYSSLAYLLLLVAATFLLFRTLGADFAVLFVAGFLCLSLTFLSYAVHGAFVTDNALPPLPDKLFDLVGYKDVGRLFFVIDSIPAALIGSFALVVLVRRRPETKRLLLSLIAGILMIWNFKISAVQLTGVPVPERSPPYMSHAEIVSQEYWRTKAVKVQGNADMMFSGHTSSTLFVCLMFLFLFKAPVFVRVVALTLFVLFVYALLLIRFHYSMDIMVGAIIGILVFLVVKHWFVSGTNLLFSEFGNLFIFSICTSVISTIISIGWSLSEKNF